MLMPVPNQGNSPWTNDTPPEAKSQTIEVVVERISEDGEIDEQLVYEVTGYECFCVEIEDVKCLECGQPGKPRRRPEASESELLVEWFYRWYENASGEYDGERDQIRSQLSASFE